MNSANSLIVNYLDTRISTNGWVFWISILLFILFLLWLFFGGGDYEYVGLAPMKIGVDSTKYINGQAYAAIEKSNQVTKNKFIASGTDKENSKPIKKVSKGEEICRNVIEEIYQKKFPCVRPNFLKNPETKRNLELDCYNDELKIAVEYNGIQHYKWPNFTGHSKEEFINQIRRDKFKLQTCDENGVYLITVPYTVPHDKIKDYIIERLPNNQKVCTISESYEDVSEDYESEISEIDFSY